MSSETEFILNTTRQRLRTFTLADAEWLLEALNEPSFRQHIGDRQVRTLTQAREYLDQHIHGHYRQHGHGMWLCERLADGQRLGMCGLLQREHLDAPDIGYAYRPAFWGKGYALEAATAVVDKAQSITGSNRLLGVTSVDNTASIGLLLKLGMREIDAASVSDDGQSRLFELMLS